LLEPIPTTTSGTDKLLDHLAALFVGRPTMPADDQGSSLHPKTWVVIADGEHARVVIPTAPHGQFATMLSFDSITAHLPSHDLDSERPGRVNERGSTTRHAIEPRQDPHKAAKHEFVAEMAKQVNAHAEAGDFDQLVLVAPAHALHDLRERLNASATNKICGSLGKDLTKTPDHDLTSHLAEWWRRPVTEPSERS
jgi:protein required for attachment to host cells